MTVQMMILVVRLVARVPIPCGLVLEEPLILPLPALLSVGMAIL